MESAFSVGDPVLQKYLDKGPSRLSQAVQRFLGGKRVQGLPLQSPTFLLYPELPTTNIYDTSTFPWASLLEENWETVKDECLFLIQTSPNFTNISSSVTVWNAFYLVDEGRFYQENIQKCPRTWEVLQSVPMVQGCTLGYVYISVVKPGTIITPHCGPTNTKLRCHLPLVPDLPTSELGMQIGQETVQWVAGKCLVFDDSFLHSVWHKGSFSSGDRVVLLIDFWHPDLKEGVQLGGPNKGFPLARKYTWVAQPVAVFTVPGVPGNGCFTPQMGMETSEPLPCRLEAKVSVYLRPNELLFVFEYNNAGAKWHTDEQSFKLPHTPNPQDFQIEGYRAKTIRLRRPPPVDDVFFL